MSSFAQSLIYWYSQNKRDLPWRNTKNPYKIWVSEIILQQTRVNQGLGYYYNFIKTYPDVFSLAETHIDDLMKVWQGLGYYSRARNMHYTAKETVNKYKGQFPSDYDNLIKLKGIGQYTASAIASFAFNYPVPVLDGNVYRVLSRLFGIFESGQTAEGNRIFLAKAQELMPKDQPGTFNQAIMEFGAIQCTPMNPNCSVCPLKLTCYALEKNMVKELPVKKKKIKQKTRHLNYLYITHNEETFIEKRTQRDIWKYLYQLPLIETKNKESVEELIENEEWKRIFDKVNYSIDNERFEKRHLLTHQRIESSIFKVRIENLNSHIQENYLRIPIYNLKDYSFPRLLDNYFEVINN